MNLMIYGVALLAGCAFLGSFFGNLLGLLTGLNSDIGGVGFAMIFLLLATNTPQIASRLPKGSSEGINFWKAMFIPVVIAMAASQNVYKAISGGWLALVAGVSVVLVSFLLIPVFNKFAPKSAEQVDSKEAEV